jgi:hypothetical protein
VPVAKKFPFKRSITKVQERPLMINRQGNGQAVAEKQRASVRPAVRHLWHRIQGAITQSLALSYVKGNQEAFAAAKRISENDSDASVPV